MASATERQKFTVPLLAKLWGVSTNKVLHFVRTGELRAINIATRTDQRPRYLIDRADIDSFEQSRQVVPDGGEPTTPRLRRLSKQQGVKEFL